MVNKSAKEVELEIFLVFATNGRVNAYGAFSSL
jgi:hypothetical protein